MSFFGCVACLGSLIHWLTQPLFCQNLVHQIHDRFFLQVLSAGLVLNSPSEANLHTILVCETLSQLDSNALTSDLTKMLLTVRIS